MADVPTSLNCESPRMREATSYDLQIRSCVARSHPKATLGSAFHEGVKIKMNEFVKGSKKRSFVQHHSS